MSVDERAEAVPEAAVTDGAQGKRSMARDLMWTAVTSIALIVGNVVLNYLLARRGAVDVYGPYNLAKRVAAGLMPALTLGMTIGLVRFIAGTALLHERRRYQTAAVTVSMSVLLAGTALMAIFAEQIARPLLGEADIILLWAMWAYAAALTINAVLYSFYRGEMLQTRANWNNLLAMIIIPAIITAIAPAGWSAAYLLYAAAGVIILWNGSQLGLRTWKAYRHGLRTAELSSSMRPLLSFSLPRVPALISDELVLALPPLMATRAGAGLSATYVLAGMALATVISASLATFGVVLLPRVSEMHSSGNHEAIRYTCSRLIYLMSAVAAVAVPVFWIASPVAVRLWLGDEFVAGIPAIRAVLLSVPPVLLYITLKSIVDGTSVRPVNSYASVAGLIVCFAIAISVSPQWAVALSLSYVVGRWITAAAVLMFIWFKFSPRIYLARLLTLTAVMVTSAWAVAAITAHLAGFNEEVAVTALSAVLGVGGLSLALRLAPEELHFSQTISRLMKRATHA